jgi:hypothetical protein
MRWYLSPGHHSATTLSLGLLVSEVGSNHILHSDAHSLVYRNLGITKPSRLLTQEPRLQKLFPLRGLGREFAATNRSRLRSVQRLDKQAMLVCQIFWKFAAGRIIANGRHMGSELYPV